MSSGKAALAVALLAMRSLSPRRKVILPAYTCFSVPSAIVKAGLEPVPCDIAPGTFDYDDAKLSLLLDDGVLCVISVHLFGIPSNTARVKQMCAGRGIFVVEDAAQAMGVSQDGVMLGTRGHVGFFSLGRGKNLTCGTGGLIVSNRDDVCEAVGRVVETLAPVGFRDDSDRSRRPAAPWSLDLARPVPVSLWHSVAPARRNHLPQGLSDGAALGLRCIGDGRLASDS